MAVRPLIHIHNEIRSLRGIVASLALGLSLTACGHIGSVADLGQRSRANEQASSPAQSGRNELQRALVYWGQEYAKNPGNAKAAVAYSKNLKAAGQKKRAFSVLQNASIYNSGDKGIASEYGRLALDQGQVKLAHTILKRALDPNKPDWRILSALGTTYAKTGNHTGAQKYFQQAMQLAPGRSSIVNNLALSYALDGKPAQAEKYLRKAVAMGGNGSKVRQNLALILGVQGRYDEAKTVSAPDLGGDGVAQNDAFLRDMVNKPAVKAPEASPSTGVSLASADGTGDAEFRGAQRVSDPGAGGTWNAQVASVDNRPLNLTPSNR